MIESTVPFIPNLINQTSRLNFLQDSLYSTSSVGNVLTLILTWFILNPDSKLTLNLILTQDLMVNSTLTLTFTITPNVIHLGFILTLSLTLTLNTNLDLKANSAPNPNPNLTWIINSILTNPNPKANPNTKLILNLTLASVAQLVGASPSNWMGTG